MKNLQEFVDKPEPIGPSDRPIQIWANERYDKYVLMRSGRIFFARARGQSGAYDNWHELNLIEEITRDLFPDNI